MSDRLECPGCGAESSTVLIKVRSGEPKPESTGMNDELRNDCETARRRREAPGVLHDESCCMNGARPGWGAHPDCPGKPAVSPGHGGTPPQAGSAATPDPSAGE